MTRPPYVALCGFPQSGKTTLAEFLVKRYGAELVDDGQVLREAAQPLYGLTADDVYTQAGKAKTYELCGKTFTNRQLLGDLGALLEGFYGEQVIPELTFRRLESRKTKGRKPTFYVFPSVRKSQGVTYKTKGGVVVAVTREGTRAVNDFDRYEYNLVDYWLPNNSTIEQFFDEAIDLFENRLGYVPRLERAA